MKLPWECPLPSLVAAVVERHHRLINGEGDPAELLDEVGRLAARRPYLALAIAARLAEEAAERADLPLSDEFLVRAELEATAAGTDT